MTVSCWPRRMPRRPRFGLEREQNADMEADTVVMRRATEPAKNVEQEEGTDDPNDRHNCR